MEKQIPVDIKITPENKCGFCTNSKCCTYITEELAQALREVAGGEPGKFAITIEKPGGVVVSSRERLPLLAKVG